MIENAETAGKHSNLPTDLFNLRTPTVHKKIPIFHKNTPRMCTTHQIGKYLSTYPPEINKK
jgi:hypothetical protein